MVWAFIFIVWMSAVVFPPHVCSFRSLRWGNCLKHKQRPVLSTKAQPQHMTVEEFRQNLKGKMFLAPLTRGGTLPFRRLCADFGAEFTMSEMAYSKQMASSNTVTRNAELTRARSAANEKYFGLQLGTKSASEALTAVQNALSYSYNAAAGSRHGVPDELINEPDTKTPTRISWIDINCGCPTKEAAHKGVGAIMLRSPKKVERLVRAMVGGISEAPVTDTSTSTDENLSTRVSETVDLLKEVHSSFQGLSVPLTVKIRLGVDVQEHNCFDVVEKIADAGAAAVFVHGRTMYQRYTKPANWSIINELAHKFKDVIPVIGNGDVLTWYEAEDRLHGGFETCSFNSAKGGALSGVMVGRGALVKPWIFKEFLTKSDWEPTVHERIEIYWRLGQYYKEYFGNDDFGKKKAFYFFPWHFNFLCRYRPLPEALLRGQSRACPLMQNSRIVDDILESEGLLQITGDEGNLNRLLMLNSDESHLAIARALWDANTPEEASANLIELARTRLELLSQIEGRAGNDRDERSDWSSRG